MFYSNQRDQLRKVFFDTWYKHNNQLALEPVEQQVLQVILDHPEYHAMLSNKDKYIDKDYLPEFGETNPFLHMSLHLGIREQISTNRPKGITSIFKKLLAKYSDDYLEAEHQMIDVLAEGIWEAQRSQTLPDEKQYIKKLKRLL